jgi:hypothetical protein
VTRLTGTLDMDGVLGLGVAFYSGAILDGAALTGLIYGSATLPLIKVPSAGLRAAALSGPFGITGIPFSADNFDLTINMGVYDATNTNTGQITNSVSIPAGTADATLDFTGASPTITGTDLTWQAGNNAFLSTAGLIYGSFISAFANWD